MLSLSLLINYSCTNEEDDAKLHGGRDVVVDPGGNVVNQVDDNNSKQGKWLIYHEGNENTMTNLRWIIYEGWYKDDKKVGYWKEFSRYGEVVDSIFYVEGVQKIEKSKTYTYSPK